MQVIELVCHVVEVVKRHVLMCLMRVSVIIKKLRIPYIYLLVWRIVQSIPIFL